MNLQPSGEGVWVVREAECAKIIGGSNRMTSVAMSPVMATSQLCDATVAREQAAPALNRLLNVLWLTGQQGEWRKSQRRLAHQKTLRFENLALIPTAPTNHAGDLMCPTFGVTSNHLSTTYKSYWVLSCWFGLFLLALIFLWKGTM